MSLSPNPRVQGVVILARGRLALQQFWERARHRDKLHQLWFRGEQEALKQLLVVGGVGAWLGVEGRSLLPSRLGITPLGSCRASRAGSSC